MPSFLHARDRVVDVPGYGEIAYDMAFGGNFYALTPAADAGSWSTRRARSELIEAGLAVMEAINAADRPVHPEDPRISGCHHVVFHEPGRDGADARRRDVDPPRLAGPLAVRDGHVGPDGAAARPRRVGAGEPFVNESVIGTRFTGRLVEETTVAGRPAIIPEITGRAWITGMGQYLLDADGPVSRRVLRCQRASRPWTARQVAGDRPDCASRRPRPRWRRLPASDGRGPPGRPAAHPDRSATNRP